MRVSLFSSGIVAFPMLFGLMACSKGHDDATAACIRQHALPSENGVTASGVSAERAEKLIADLCAQGQQNPENSNGSTTGSP
jgi:hypothetical protein